MALGVRIATLLLLGLSFAKSQDAGDAGPRPWINEFHYDNKGTDVNEFVEIAAPEGFDISSWQLILYNGFYGRVYAEDAYHPLVSFTKGDTVNGVDFYYLPIRPANCSSLSAWCGLQNGKDGFALAQYFTATSGRVVELISYEGTFFAKDGPATNMTSRDIGVMQRTTTPQGHSISKIGTGCDPDDFYWENVDVRTMGTVNTNQTITCAVAFINEIHYDNVNDGEGQFLEVASNAEDISDYTIVLYSGEDGLTYGNISLSSFEAGDTSDDGLTFYVYEFSSGGGSIGLVVEGSSSENTTATGLALIKDDTVLEFISYGGEFVAQDGLAEGLTSMDIGVEETSETPLGSSLQLIGVGCSSEDFLWEAVEANQIDINPMGSTPGEANIGQDIDCTVEVPEPETHAPDEADDLVMEDDDFLGEDAVMMDVGEPVVVEYTAGQRNPVPMN